MGHQKSQFTGDSPKRPHSSNWSLFRNVKHMLKVIFAELSPKLGLRHTDKTNGNVYSFSAHAAF